MLGFLAVGVFSTHVTGNIALMFATLDTSGVGLLGRLLAVPVFALAALAASVAATRRGAPGRGAIRTLLAAEVVLLLSDMAAAARLDPTHHARAALPLAVALILVAAMGVHNAVNRFGVPRGNATTATTVNVSQAAVDIGRLLNRRADPATHRRLRAAVPVILAFAVGAGAGAGGYALARVWGLALPAAVVAGCAVLW